MVSDLYLSPVSLIRDDIDIYGKKNNFPCNIGILIMKHFLYSSLSCLTCKFEVVHATLN